MKQLSTIQLVSNSTSMVTNSSCSPKLSKLQLLLKNSNLSSQKNFLIKTDK